ncbi:polysaccharide intercellular adhesin biosynthesis/export protein IcaC, partial [Staphylococcus aureus]
PYILMGLFYSYSESLLTDTSFQKQFIENVLLGQWYGYFIVVIMQFFILSYIIFKINYNLFNSKILLLLSFILQQSFLYYFTNNTAFHDTVLHYYPLSENTIIFGWIFYFFLGAYMGYNYERVLNFLERYLVIMIVLAVATYFVFIALANGDYWNVTSFSYSLTPYNSIMFIVILGICTHFKTMLFNTIQMISAFSFFIYLLHPIILDSLFAYTNIFEDNTMVFLAISLLLILGLCIGVGMILREFYIFRFIIGKQPYKLNINAY